MLHDPHLSRVITPINWSSLAPLRSPLECLSWGRGRAVLGNQILMSREFVTESVGAMDAGKRDDSEQLMLIKTRHHREHRGSREMPKSRVERFVGMHHRQRTKSRMQPD